MRISPQLTALNDAKTSALAAKAGLDERQQKRLKNACQDFEAMFLANMLKSMRKTVEKTNLFGSDSGEETFQEMMDNEVSKAAAKTSSMGIADLMYRQVTNDLAKKAEAAATSSKAGAAAESLKLAEVKADD